jgi:hypothetical protein
MPRSTCLAMTSLLSGALTALATATLASPAQAAPGRYSMEQCVDRVLSRLARAGADEAQVGPTVLSQCDGPLRAALADAIQSGEAPLCTVESCMGMARSRASDEATAEYRQRLRRR